MMLAQQLIERIKSYKPQVNEKLLKLAYDYAKDKHKDQKRACGQPYFSHPLAVANILIDMRLDETTIAVGLLHDTLEDTSATKSEIIQLLGPEIGNLVEGLTKLNRLDHYSKKAIEGENLRKLLVATSKDVRILLVKLADRLHNMRTLEAVASLKRIRIAQETMDLYAPLADRIGMRDMRGELEDLAFRHLNPHAYDTISQRLDYLFQKNKDLLITIERSLTDRFRSCALKTRVLSRRKRPYAVFHKMQSKGLAFEQLSDIFGFRVIVESVANCYRALGIIHTSWSMVPERFKDYISTPKANDYRSLHTTIIGPASQRIELQIRTSEMNEIAEYGLAAHPLYKEIGARSSSELLNELNAYAWIRKTLQMLAEGDNPEEFLEHTKLELFKDQVFCFTPKGKMISLPRDATPIDFAYEIHTELGDSCIGAKINGKPMPLIAPLKNGDEVEILRADTNMPVRAWADLVKTGKARAAIRRATRSADYKHYYSLGKDILRHYFAQRDKAFCEEELAFIVGQFSYKTLDDFFVAIGRHELKPAQIFKTLLASQISTKNGASKANMANGKVIAAPTSLIENYIIPLNKKITPYQVKFGPAGAIPGDSIVGIVQDDGAIIIYPVQAKALLAYGNQPERWVDMRWNNEDLEGAYFPVKIHVFLLNSLGSLAQITSILARNHANITDLKIFNQHCDYTEMAFVIEVEDSKHLHRITAQILETKAVSLVKRVYN